MFQRPLHLIFLIALFFITIQSISQHSSDQILSDEQLHAQIDAKQKAQQEEEEKEEQELRQQIGEQFDRFDINKDAQLGIGELEGFIGKHIKSEEQLIKVIKAYDSNKNGVIDRDEFINLIMEVDSDAVVDHLRTNDDPEIQKFIKEYDQLVLEEEQSDL